MRYGDQRRVAPLIGFVIVSIAATGYFTGLNSSMNPAVVDSVPHSSPDESVAKSPIGIIPATDYQSIAKATQDRAVDWKTQLQNLKSSVDLFAEVRIKPGEKQQALQQREQNRAFNGAPPTIPHPIDSHSTLNCIACHGEGIRTATLRIPRMSHRFLTNCTQCHVESRPQHLPAAEFRENRFVGLAAPTEGPRAYPGAPPQIPHSTWMRSDCMSCHGTAGLQGIRTTHPWRQNCQQCHAPSASLDQTLLVTKPRFLPGPVVAD